MAEHDGKAEASMTSARLAGCIGVGAVLLLAPGRSVAESVPRPPCAGAPSPAYADLGSLPAVRVWTGDELGTAWKPPACTGWRPLAFRTLVARGKHDPGRGADPRRGHGGAL